MTTTRLKNNAFDEQQETFLTLNIDKEKEQISKKGIKDGRKNIPNSQASTPTELEYGILEQIKQTAQQTHQTLSNHFTGFSARLMPFEEIMEPQAKINGIYEIKNNMEQDLEEEINKFEQEGIIKKSRWQDAEKSYEQFRQDNHLTRSASYSPGQSALILLLVIILEASLNASLLVEFMGGLPAFGQTVLITAVNVVIGAAPIGLLLRYKNVPSRKRWLAFISILIVFPVLVFNFGVGHYRDALTEAKAREEQQLLSAPDWETFSSEPVVFDFIDYTQQAMERFRSSLFGIDSVLSVLLIIIGIGCFGFAAYKWYSMFDPCPGYRMYDLKRNEAHKKYTELIKTVQNKIDRIIKTAQDKINDERIKTINMHTQRADLVNRAQTLKQNYIIWISTLGTQQDRLLRLYRDKNLEVRSEPPPSYFGKDIPIDVELTQPPDFTPPDANNIEMIVQAAEDTRKEIDYVADSARQKFRKLSDMQSQTAELELHTL